VKRGKAKSLSSHYLMRIIKKTPPFAQSLRYVRILIRVSVYRFEKTQIPLHRNLWVSFTLKKAAIDIQ